MDYIAIENELGNDHRAEESITRAWLDELKRNEIRYLAGTISRNKYLSERKKYEKRVNSMLQRIQTRNTLYRRKGIQAADLEIR